MRTDRHSFCKFCDAHGILLFFLIFQIFRKNDKVTFSEYLCNFFVCIFFGNLLPNFQNKFLYFMFDVSVILTNISKKTVSSMYDKIMYLKEKLSNFTITFSPENH